MSTHKVLSTIVVSAAIFSPLALVPGTAVARPAPPACNVQQTNNINALLTNINAQLRSTNAQLSVLLRNPRGNAAAIRSVRSAIASLHMRASAAIREVQMLERNRYFCFVA